MKIKDCGKTCMDCIFKIFDEMSDVVYCGETNKVILDMKDESGDYRTCDKYLERNKRTVIKSYEDEPIF